VLGHVLLQLLRAWLGGSIKLPGNDGMKIPAELKKPEIAAADGGSHEHRGSAP